MATYRNGAPGRQLHPYWLVYVSRTISYRVSFLAQHRKSLVRKFHFFLKRSTCAAYTLDVTARAAGAYRKWRINFNTTTFSYTPATSLGFNISTQTYRRTMSSAN